MSEETLLIDPPVEDPSTLLRGALPRLLAGIPPDGAMSLDEHFAVHGQAPAPDAVAAADRSRP